MSKMKLSEFCKNNGISYITGYRWFKNGKMPANVRAHQTPSGTILVENVETATTTNAQNYTDQFAALVTQLQKSNIDKSFENIQTNSNTYYSNNVIASSLSEPVGASVTFDTSGAHIKFDQSFTIASLASLDQKINYDEAKSLADMMVSAGLLTADPIKVDQQAKTICTWNRSAYESITNLVMKK